MGMKTNPNLMNCGKTLFLQLCPRGWVESIRSDHEQKGLWFQRSLATGKQQTKPINFRNTHNKIPKHNKPIKIPQSIRMCLWLVPTKTSKTMIF